MGKVIVTFRATNYDDLSDYARKRRKTRPRVIEAEALVIRTLTILNPAL